MGKQKDACPPYLTATNPFALSLSKGEQINLNYDAADRLIAANNQHWQYDDNSNRIQQQDNSGVTDYTLDPTSNRLLSSTGANYQTYQHDANGNTLQDTAHSYRYDAQNRLVAVDNGKTAQYRHNALGQRVYKKAQQLDCDYTHDGIITNADIHAVNGKEGKTNSQTKGKDEDKEKTGDKNEHQENGKTVACAATQIGDHANQGKNQSKGAKPTDGLLFTYDETGKLLGEYTESGTAQQETVWLNNLPVATVKNNTPYAIHTDHLGTPRVITDSKKCVIWRWNSDPFGTTLANEDPDGDGKAFNYNPRFAGQYYDQETGLHYNYFRDYDPRTGRYVESDPIGLDGGINTYGYVGENPLGFVDPLGLSFADCQAACAKKGLTVKSVKEITKIDILNLGYEIDEVCECDDECPLNSYENPGHHDPKGGKEPYNPRKSVLPKNHEDLWKNSRATSDGENRWTKVGEGKKAEYHRFQSDGNGNWHWNGSSNATKANGTPNPISPNDIPVEVKRW